MVVVVGGGPNSLVHVLAGGLLVIQNEL